MLTLGFVLLIVGIILALVAPGAYGSRGGYAAIVVGLLVILIAVLSQSDGVEVGALVAAVVPVARYRKKPVVIEAEGPIENERIIETPEGPMHASPGDYIITGVEGEKYPRKPDIFEATYEQVA